MRHLPQTPPLLSLRAFEVVGRLMSFRLAGEELCISQSAVSYHIKTLEEDLGVKLFSRHARGVAFTEQGSAYFELVGDAFRRLQEGSAAVRLPGDPVSLQVSVLPSFAAMWLVSRLEGFRASHPEIQVVLDPGIGLSDLNRGDADIAIRYGTGDWPELGCELLLAERLCPLASPAFLQSQAPAQSPADVLRHTLLLTSRAYEWDFWAKHFALDLRPARTLQLTDYNIVLQAAADGLGVAMGRRFMTRARVNAGVLVPLFGEWVSVPSLGYWVCTPRQGVKPAAQAFATWLRAEAAAERPDAR